MPVYICQYVDECPIYNEKIATNGTPIVIYKNVFCYRGLAGWNNCKQYIEYQSNALSNNPSSNEEIDKNIDDTTDSKKEEK